MASREYPLPDFIQGRRTPEDKTIKFDPAKSVMFFTRRLIMIRRLLGALSLIVLPAVSGLALVPSPGTSCVNLKALTIPSVQITSAAAVPAGPFNAPGSRNPITLPAFCRVEGV